MDIPSSSTMTTICRAQEVDFDKKLIAEYIDIMISYYEIERFLLSLQQSWTHSYVSIKNLMDRSKVGVRDVYIDITSLHLTCFYK